MSKIQNIKNHVKKYQTYYVVGGAVVAAAGCGYLGYKLGSTRRIDQVISPKNQNIAAVVWKPKQTIEVYVEALGDPGNIIQDTTTGVIYASQGQAARELGLDAPAISKHLNGLSPHVKGHTFTRLAKATVPPLEPAA